LAGLTLHIVRARVYLVEQRLYQVVVFGPKDLATSKDALEFLDSFELPVAFSAAGPVCRKIDRLWRTIANRICSATTQGSPEENDFATSISLCVSGQAKGVVL
jgi:hypothetical protein